MKIEKRTVVIEVQTCTLKLTREMVVGALVRAGYKINSAAEVSVFVPGGGDWSNTNLDISDKTPLIVHWTQSQTSTEER